MRRELVEGWEGCWAFWVGDLDWLAQKLETARSVKFVDMGICYLETVLDIYSIRERKAEGRRNKRRSILQSLIAIPLFMLIPSDAKLLTESRDKETKDKKCILKQ